MQKEGFMVKKQLNSIQLAHLTVPSNGKGLNYQSITTSKTIEKSTKENLLNEDYIPVAKWNHYRNYPSVGAIRQYMFKNTNDFNKLVIRKIAKKYYIKVSAFDEWVESNNKS